MSCGHRWKGDWRRRPVQSLVFEEEAFLGRNGDFVVLKGDSFPNASGQLGASISRGDGDEKDGF